MSNVDTNLDTHVDTASNVDTSPSPDNLQRFQIVCQSRALLWQLDDLEWHDAIDACVSHAERLGIDPDTAQTIMAQAFGAVLEAP